MSAPLAPDAHPESEHRRRVSTRPALGLELGLDVLVVTTWFVVVGVLGALAWWLVVDLPHATKVQGGVVIEPAQLTGQVSIDGWYFVIAAVGGVLSGVALTAWRRRDPLVVVVLVVLGAGLAAFLMVRLGLLLGPDSPDTVLRSKAEGATAPVRLELLAPGMAWVWPLAAALGSLAVLWGVPNRDEQDA